MLVYGGVSTSFRSCATMLYNHKHIIGVKAHSDNISRHVVARFSIKTSSYHLVTTTAAAAVLLFVVGANAVEIQAQQDAETLSNIPDTLSGKCELDKDCKMLRIQRPNSKKAEFCTTRCVNACIHGSDASGSLGKKGPIVVFRKGFRSRQYCLVECSDICNLIGDGEDGF